MNEADSVALKGRLDALLDALEQPWPEEAVERTYTSSREVNGKQVRGTGKGYDTTGIKYQWVVDRANRVLSVLGWSATDEIVDTVREKYSTGTPKITITTKVRVVIDLAPLGIAFGAQRSCYGVHTSTTFGDAAKGAFTNGLKKTLALLGAGVQAYRDELDDDHAPAPEEGAKPSVTQPRAGRKPKRSAEPIAPIGQSAEKLDLSTLASALGTKAARHVCRDLPADRREWSLDHVHKATLLLRDAALGRIEELGEVLGLGIGNLTDLAKEKTAAGDWERATAAELAGALKTLEADVDAMSQPETR